MNSRCLFVNNSPQPGRAKLAKLGGGGKSLLGLIKAMPALGWEASVVVPGEGQFTDLVRAGGTSCLVFPYQPLSAGQPLAAIAQTRRWLQIFRALRPSLIHANGFDISRSFALAAGIARIPYLTHVRFPSDPAGIRWTLRGLPRPAGFIFNSRAMQQRMWQHVQALAPRASAHVAHNAVDLDEFSPAPWPQAERPRIGIIANFAPFKRHEDFIAMASELRRRGLDAEFWIIGDDTEGRGRRAALEALAQRLGVSDAVRFFGHRTDIPDLIRQLHLLAVTSEFEPFGRVIIEAMACGRPVVGTNDGGVPEIIADGVTGRLVPLRAPREMAAAVAAILTNRPLWETMAAAAAEAARARFSLDAHVAAITRIYEETLGAGQR